MKEPETRKEHTDGGTDFAPDEGNSRDCCGEHRAFVTELLDRIHVSGYTIIGNISGKGHHGIREAHFMFSEQESLEMILTVVPEEKSSRSSPGFARSLNVIPVSRT